MSDAKLCIVLLNHENWRDTLECLESLARLSYRQLAVLVVDTGSPDDSVPRLREWVESGGDRRGSPAVWRRLPSRPTVRPRACEILDAGDHGAARSLERFADLLTIVDVDRPLGFAAGCNQGLRLALGDPEVEYVWLLNNDTVVAPDSA